MTAKTTRVTSTETPAPIMYIRKPQKGIFQITLTQFKLDCPCTSTDHRDVALTLQQKHQTCFKCSESHHMTDCKSVTLKCNACGKEGHGASAESCPERKKEKARMKRAKEEALPFWPLRASSRETLNGQEQERSSPPASTTPTVTTSSEVTPASTQVEQGLYTREILANRANSPQGEEAGAWGGRAPGRQPQLYQQEHGTSSF